MNTIALSGYSSMLALTLMHFVWQGFVLFVCGELALQVFRPKQPQTRYFARLLLMLLLTACPVITFVGLDNSQSFAQPSITSEGGRFLLAHSIDSSATTKSEAIPIAQSSNSISRWLIAQVERNSTLLVTAWLLGVLVMGSRLIGAAFAVRTLKRESLALPDDVSTIVGRLAARMGFRAPPPARLAIGLSQAMAIGVMKPLILLPAAWIAELPPAVLEVVIAHELAHLRRWDLPINFLQRVLETLFFFHPVVWWWSKRLRVEREMCCDLLAAQVIDDREVYARSLAYVAQRVPGSGQPVLTVGFGGTEMVLLGRIRNVLGMSSQRRWSWTRVIGFFAVAAVLIGLSWKLLGDKETPLPVTVVQKGLPTERAKATLPVYRIEPPDILTIDALRLVGKPPYRILSTDVLEVEIAGLLDPRRFQVDSEGRINLGSSYVPHNMVSVVGKTTDEAAQSIAKAAAETYADPQVSVTIVQAGAMQPVSGEHLVALDGTVTLGSYGQVYVAGMTLVEATQAITKHLEQFLDHPKVSVSVFAYNSKAYYVIVESAASKDMVYRFPTSGHETVLDAIAQVKEIDDLSNKRIFIARPPSGEGATDFILPVDWREIALKASTAANYQVLPGDRIFIVDPVSSWSRWNPLSWFTRSEPPQLSEALPPTEAKR